MGLDSLVKLKLDNNKIWKIQNLDHLVNLQWLGAPPARSRARATAAPKTSCAPCADPLRCADLSFNNIEKIEGLSTLTKLTDLSLFNNLISELEGLEALQELSALSLGNNQLVALESVMYLRQIPSVRILNLAGNPICTNEDYRQYVLAHIKDLRYLDYRLVDAGAVQASRERYQDAILEIEEAEAVIQKKADKEAKDDEHAKFTAAANLSGIETLFATMIAEDKDQMKVKSLDTLSPPMLQDSLDEYEREFSHSVEEVVEVVLERYEKKKLESTDFSAAMVQAKVDNMQIGIDMIAKFDLLKKQTFRQLSEEEDPIERTRLEEELREANEVLRDQLMELEIELQEQVETVTGVYYKLYKEVVDFNGTTFQDFFQKLRGLETAWSDKLLHSAKELMETFSAAKEADKDKGKKGGDDEAGMSLGGVEGYDEQLKALLGDKELLLGSITASHENHGMKLDGKEDEMLTNEKKELENIMDGLGTDEHRRSRLRVSEILKVVDEVNTVQIDEAFAAANAEYDE